MLWYSYMNLGTYTSYVSFNTNLNLYIKKPILNSPQCIWMVISLLALGLFLSGCKEERLLLIISTNTELFGNVFIFLLKFKKIISITIFNTLPIYTFSIAVTPATCTVCLIVFQIWCLSCKKHVPFWLPLILILLSNDVHLNPGPNFQNNCFNFMPWNVNSLAKDNFQCVSLIEAHNSFFNYDMISNCETSLNDSVELPGPLLNDYTFIPANYSANTRHGGVGLFYKNSLPVVVRNDLSFDESIVVEMKFGRKRIFFTVLYRSPAFHYNSHNFQTFLSNVINLYAKIKSENPYATFFTGDFNAHSQFWWPDGDSTPEGSEIEHLLTSLGLLQVISEPTNFEPNKKPS